MTGTPYNVLFLCTGNSCRSILAECILNAQGEGRFRAFSAGSHPGGQVHPLALELLEQRGHPTGGLRSKAWEEFAQADAPRMDFVITVCDRAAGEVCPIWPGRPVTAHLGFPDPARLKGTEAETRAFFAQVYGQIHDTLSALTGPETGDGGRTAIEERLKDLATERQAPS